MQRQKMPWIGHNPSMRIIRIRTFCVRALVLATLGALGLAGTAYADETPEAAGPAAAEQEAVAGTEPPPPEEPEAKVPPPEEPKEVPPPEEVKAEVPPPEEVKAEVPPPEEAKEAAPPPWAKKKPPKQRIPVRAPKKAGRRPLGRPSALTRRSRRLRPCAPPPQKNRRPHCSPS
jgi:outer membrane biosynthesis protein TonB